MIYPYIEDAVTNYYGKNVMTAPYMTKIIKASRNSSNQGCYDLQIQVEPYTGPHIEVGIDQVTLYIGSDSIRVVDFKHIKSFQ
jgi:hypothetical protein